MWVIGVCKVAEWGGLGGGMRGRLTKQTQQHVNDWWIRVKGIQKFLCYSFNFSVNLKVYQNYKLPKNVTWNFSKRWKLNLLPTDVQQRDFYGIVLQKGNTVIPKGRSQMQSKAMISILINPNKHWMEKTPPINNV